MKNVLSTHVLDTSLGKPGQGITIQLFERIGDENRLICTRVTNDDGRCDEPLLAAEELTVGVYELVFAAGDYLRQQHGNLPNPAFLDEVVIRFGIFDGSRSYHVPLLISPYGYSSYLGS